jgi:hypothetical protein
MHVDGKMAPWRTHDWKVRTLESIAAGGGSRLAFTCRSCGRIFNQTTINSRTWAVDELGVALNDSVTNRWLAEACLRRPADSDDEDRRQFKNGPVAPN